MLLLVSSLVDGDCGAIPVFTAVADIVLTPPCASLTPMVNSSCCIGFTPPPSPTPSVCGVLSRNSPSGLLLLPYAPVAVLVPEDHSANGEK